IVGRLRNNNYEKDGEEVYALAFTAEELDYLDSKAESEARRTRGQGPASGEGGESEAPAATRTRRTRSERQSEPAHA
ncbi:MAG TPA: single-stranded DNA-binding protein, partial [Methylibium sp.]|nr:single-stranded DNA-binding protein [Methylibium sp.]